MHYPNFAFVKTILLKHVVVILRLLMVYVIHKKGKGKRLSLRGKDIKRHEQNSSFATILEERLGCRTCFMKWSQCN